METFDSQQKMQYKFAKERVNILKKFYANLIIFAIIFTIFEGRQFLENRDMFVVLGKISIIFWIWGIILAMKAVKLFVFNQTWERNQLNKFLKNNKNGNF